MFPTPQSVFPGAITAPALFELVTGRLTDKSAKRNVVVFAENKARLTHAADMVDAQLSGAISRALRSTRFQGSATDSYRFTLQTGPVSQVLVVGLGRQSGMERRDWWQTGLKIGRQLDAMGWREATLALGDLGNDAEIEAGQALVEGIGMALYRFEYLKEVKEHQQPRFEKLTLLTTTRAAREIEENFPATRALLNATALTRDCANLPPNVVGPQFMADQALKLKELGVKVDIIDEKQMAKLGLNLFLAVGGSAAEADQPRMVIMHYNGSKSKDAPIALVGKGITFDTGGYNIKGSPNMGGMKFDMSGAATVLGAMQALAARKAPVNVVGVMACAYNLIGQNVFVPDSVYKSYKGLFVEIGNTDAEGRLVLADAIAYTIDTYKPSQLVDLATLTGACMVALGGGYAGLFSTQNALANALQKAGDFVGERLWRMPVDDFYAAPPTVADVNNNGAPYGGASTAAVFLKKFADKTPWAHLDIAGVANKDKGPAGQPEAFKGATGFGVRLLVNWLESTATSVPETIEAVPRRRGRPVARRAVQNAVAPAGTRGRGRPRKNPQRDNQAAASVAATNPAATDAQPRRRGRPPKARA